MKAKLARNVVAIKGGGMKYAAFDARLRGVICLFLTKRKNFSSQLVGGVLNSVS